MLQFLYVLFAICLTACVTEPNSNSPGSNLESSKSLPPDENAKEAATMQVEKDDPRAVEIMNKDCENGYDVLNLDHTKDKPQAEVGLSMPINEQGGKVGPVKPFIYYRCRSSNSF